MATRTLECLDCGWTYEWDVDDPSSDAAACPLCKELGQILEREATRKRDETWRRYELSSTRLTRLLWVVIGLAIVAWVFWPFGGDEPEPEPTVPQQMEDIDCEAMLTEAMEEYCVQLQD